MTITGVAVATTQFLSGMCDCMVDCDVGTDDFSRVQAILQVCGHVHGRSQVSPGIFLKLVTTIVVTN